MFPLNPFVPAGLLLLAALAGAFLVVRLLRGLGYPRIFGGGHGLLALLGVGLLAYTALAGPAAPFLDDGTLFLLMAAFGGLTLAALARGGHPPPGVLVFLHALFALFGLVLLAIGLAHLPAVPR